MSAAKRARVAAVILADAEHRGMPEPTDVELMPEGLRFGFGSIADLAEWAKAMSATIEERGQSPFRYHVARATHWDFAPAVGDEGQPIECWFIEVDERVLLTPARPLRVVRGVS